MASYPPNKFVQEFAKRTHQNLIDLYGKRPLSYEDSALIGSLFAVFVLPHERADDREFMSSLLNTFERKKLDEIVTVLRVEPSASSESDMPQSVGDIPRFLRNAVAHLNIKPETVDGYSLTHFLIWNTNPRNQKITFVARVEIAKLRELAKHILTQLSRAKTADRYNGFDPIAKFDKDHSSDHPIDT